MRVGFYRATQVSNGRQGGRERDMPVRPEELCPVEGEALGKGEVDAENGDSESQLQEFKEDDEAGARVPVRIADPRLPSADEIEQHNMTHLPYRSWCPHCIRGKGKTMEHRRAAREELMRGSTWTVASCG